MVFAVAVFVLVSYRGTRTWEVLPRGARRTGDRRLDADGWGYPKLGASRYSDVYGGMWKDTTDTLHICVVESGVRVSVFIAEIERLATELGRKCAVSPVAHTWQELASLTPMISETPGLESAGIRPVAWGPDPASNSILVRVIGSVDAARALFDEQFGSGRVTVEPWVGELPWRL
ncbi:MAG TPA: hypothetical protein VND62_10840 [Acidimicrobiales bacterium]|nr:hypothetical protein [Acidimicrobiales bacterium]